MIIRANLISAKITSNTAEAHNLFSTNRFGEKSGEKIFYSLPEALFLVRDGKMKIADYRGDELNQETILRRFEKIDKNFETKYLVFRDLRKKGYIVKTALKFGAEFRVYDKNQSVGKNHSKWILFPVSENSVLTWHEFASKNRVAHSTKKKLLIAVVDDDADVSYYEVNWIKP